MLLQAWMSGRNHSVIRQSNALSRTLQSVVVIPLTTNLNRARLAGTAMIESRAGAPPQDPIALAFQIRAVPKTCLKERIRSVTEAEEEEAEFELATDEALGRVEPA